MDKVHVELVKAIMDSHVAQAASLREFVLSVVSAPQADNKRMDAKPPEKCDRCVAFAVCAMLGTAQYGDERCLDVQRRLSAMR